MSLKTKKILALLLSITLILIACISFAEEKIEIEKIETKTEYGYISYPKINLNNTQNSEKINNDLLISTNIANYIAKLPFINNSGWGLNIDYDLVINNNILSVLFDLKGELDSPQNNQKYIALNYNIDNGNKIIFDDAFIDSSQNVNTLLNMIQASSEKLSSYLEKNNITSIPKDNFLINEYGITFYFDSSEFKMLSGNSGAIYYNYYNLSEMTDLKGILRDIILESQKENITKITQKASEGTLPGLPIRLNENINKIIKTNNLLYDPDYYNDYAVLQFENPILDNLLIFTSYDYESNNNSEINSIFIKNYSGHSINTNETEISYIINMFGDKYKTTSITDEDVYFFEIPNGTSYSYSYGDVELIFNTDENEILSSIIITKSNMEEE